MKPISKTASVLLFIFTLFVSAQSLSQDIHSESTADASNVVANTENVNVIEGSETLDKSNQQFLDAITKLASKSFTTKSKVIKKIAASGDERVLPLLKILVSGDLYYQKSDGAIVTVKDVEDGVELTEFSTGKNLGVVGSRKAKKITINNKLRGVINSLIAGLELTSTRKSERESAARNMIKSPNEIYREPLETALEKEQNSSVKALMAVAVALLDIDSKDQRTRLDAVAILGDSVEPEAVATLKNLVKKEESGAYIEQNAKIVALAESKLKVIKTKLGMYKAASNVMFGLSLGSILLLAAIGLAITFGVMGVINMAHGEMIMLGAYTTFAVQQIFPQIIEYSLLIAVPAAFLVSGSVGVLIERLVIRHLYGRPLDTLLATFGISLVLQQLVRTYRANNVPVISPEWMSGSWVFNGAFSLTYNRIYIIVFSLIVLALLILLLKKTLFGLQMRAVTQNRPMANSMGIRSNWVDALTFGLGSGVAGIAGVALSQITNVGPNLGQAYIIDSFMVVVFGGVGNLMGTFVAAMSLGVVNKFLEPATGAVIAKIMVLIFIILFIQWRPRGLFALKGRFVED